DRDRRNGARGARLHGRYGDLGAGKEARLLPRLRDEIGLGEGLDQTLFLQRRNQRVDLDSVGIDHIRQKGAERRGGRRGSGKESVEEGNQGCATDAGGGGKGAAGGAKTLAGDAN